MKIHLIKMLAVSLATVTLLGVFSGCNTTEPEITKPDSSMGTTENPTTETPTEADPTTGTTAGDPADQETISGTENTQPTTEPITEPTEPSTELTTPDNTEKEEEACAHQYGSWSITKSATCSAAGSKERKCSACGDVQKEAIEPLSHTYSAWSATKQATCGAKGEKVRTCSTCGKKQTESIAALDHKYGAWSTTKAATCDANGVKTRTCADCGKTETQSIDSTGHVWDDGKVITQPTSCSDVGSRTYTCTNCSRTKTEQVKGNHTFGDWKYEEYTYKRQGVFPDTQWYDVVSHRKVRACTKCGYKEYGNTPDHYCAKGSFDHKITTVKEGTCSTKAKMRSTCKICGWYVEYDGRKSDHTVKTETRHLTDYGKYTNELDAHIQTCTSCGGTEVSYTKGEGWIDYNRYEVNITHYGGSAYSLEHPEWQTVERDFVYNSNGYVKQFTLYWWYNGKHHSQVIKCDKASMVAWFAEYGLDASASGVKLHLQTTTTAKPYKISWTS